MHPFKTIAEDGYSIGGFLRRHSKKKIDTRPVVIINPATSVLCRYYFRFSDFLFENGFDVITFDYRGIGVSRPVKMRGFEASWIDWGNLDFEAVIQFAERSFPGQPLYVVAHSVGGFLLGLAESNSKISRIFTMGAQYAHWKDYSAKSFVRMVLKWHVAMPLITMIFGYFPAKKLGWMEDTPKGVVRDWALSRGNFENTWRGLKSSTYPDKETLVKRFKNITAPTLAVSVTDDEFGTVSAIERLLAYFANSPRTHLRISPESIGERSIGHFAFFNIRFREKLWSIPLEWLRSGKVPGEFPGTIMRSD